MPLSQTAIGDAISAAAVGQLLDRLASAEEAGFVVSWIESIASGRGRVESGIAVRLLRAYRESGRVDRAREFAATLPVSPPSWSLLDTARLSIERAILATHEGRTDLAIAELRQASRFLAGAPRASGFREQLDLNVATAELELRLGRTSHANAAFRLAEHVEPRLDDGPARANVGLVLGHLAMRLSDPRAAVKHFQSALNRSPLLSLSSLRAHGNIAIALASGGRFDAARANAKQAVSIAAELAPGGRHADSYDVLATVEIAADAPVAAIAALDEAQIILGEMDHPWLRCLLCEHRAWALAMLDRAPAAKQALARADKFREAIGVVDAEAAQELVAVQARTFEAAGELKEALHLAMPYLELLPNAFATGNLNLIAGRAALALGDEATARIAVERAALAGDKLGWLFPDRLTSAELWAFAKKSGDSRVVRYAERMIEFAEGGSPPSLPPISISPPPRNNAPPSLPDVSIVQSDGGEVEALIYVTTAEGVARVKRTEVANYTKGVALVVDTLTHALRIDGREVSLERRRAIEPLVVQLLRRAKEGLSADEILRAAGGPGPESADAEHRVRVLISRVRDLLGDPAAIERMRDAGEHGKTRYRLATKVNFALIEPLFASGSGT
jgi:tetratricopeptide (TPR) repeat protein